METVKKSFSGIAGIIRLIVVIILIAALTFFVGRGIKNRSNTKRAEQAVQTAQTNTQKKNIQESEKKTEHKDESKADANQQVPSGIDDRANQSASETTTQAIPNVGADFDFLSLILIISIVYFGVKFIQQKRAIK